MKSPGRPVARTMMGSKSSRCGASAAAEARGCTELEHAEADAGAVSSGAPAAAGRALEAVGLAPGSASDVSGSNNF